VWYSWCALKHTVKNDGSIHYARTRRYTPTFRRNDDGLDNGITLTTLKAKKRKGVSTVGARTLMCVFV